MIEEWKDIFIDNIQIPDYQISNKGRVRRLAKYVFWKWKDSIRKRYLKLHILSPILIGYKNDRYPTVILYNKKYKVHRLVALSFLKNVYNFNIVNHLNGDRLDNRFENLE